MLPAQTCPQSWHTPAGGRDPRRSHLGDTTLLCSQVVTLRAKKWPWMLAARHLLPTADPSLIHPPLQVPGDPTAALGPAPWWGPCAPSLAQGQVRKGLPGQLWPPEKEELKMREQKSQHKL